MSPALAGFGLAACVALASLGVGMMRSTPEGARPLVDAPGAPARRSLVRLAADALGRRYGSRVLRSLSPRKLAQIRHRIDAAGHPGGMTVETYAARKAGVSLLAAGVGVLLLLVTGNPLPVLAFAALGWLAVDVRLAHAAKERQKRLDRDLPDFLDVLAVTVGAGLSFRNALRRVADAIGGPLGDEVRTSLRHLGIGASRRAAFEGLRDRNDSDALANFATALLQAEELGAPLGPTLRSIAADMRKSSHQRARRDAAKAAPRVSLIVTTVVVPGAIILIVAALFTSTGGLGSELLGG